MQKIYHKSILTASVLFFLLSQAQTKDTLRNKQQEREILAFKNKISQYDDYQKKEVQRLKGLGHQEFISGPRNEKQLVGSDENGRPMYYTTLNAGAAKMTKADNLYAGGGLGLNITGSNMKIGQWDYSKPRTTHELLAGKINSYDALQNQTISRHSTNIAGTLVGNNGDPDARGIAYEAIINAYDWSNDVNEMLSEAYVPGNNGILVANNSYGFDPMYLQTYQFGKYNMTAQSWDNLMYLKPYLQIVKAAGNAREIDPAIVPQVSAKNGYDLLEGAGVAKNVLVVASAKKNANMNADDAFDVSAFSSYGPSDDGRIKPDICAPGENMYSSIETYDSAYGVYRGTSSATAVVSGIITLLQQYYKSVSPSQSYMLSSTVRALLAHTANDKGSEGPDYIYGWGLADAKRAAAAIYNNIEGIINGEKKSTLIKEISLNQGNKYTLYVVPYELNQPLSATISWTDPQGNLVSNVVDLNSPSVINDLDLKIVRVNADGSETTYYPWKLGGMSNLTGAATNNSTNDVDTIERVDIKTPQKLTYKIIVSAKTNATPLLPNGNQTFSIVVSNVDFCYQEDLRTLTSPVDDITTSQTILAKQIVASNKVIAPVQNVEYIASRDIVLLPGFHAEQGTGFLAMITPCFDMISAMKYKAQDRGISESSAITYNAALGHFSLFPNPAKEEVNIRFSLQNESAIKISVYDASGKLILTQQSSDNFPKGEYVKTIDTRSLTTGVYVVSIETAEYKETKKLIIK
ncbi:S8 family serine peptidase [Chryseobacterium defluvii]|uniref:Putative secreted protein (Por secretion system target) n=1 Tax=Chryseobacterium defluvii TaxID=160396 RepID=A0A495SBK6_9FLAO|nr:S8 family serine peptidase [Chryseobacterium defluvii]RKS96496.1 putative secreted protein (Por secretion system target) [Chryseobacterium defluvii]